MGWREVWAELRIIAAVVFMMLAMLVVPATEEGALIFRGLDDIRRKLKARWEAEKREKEGLGLDE